MVPLTPSSCRRRASVLGFALGCLLATNAVGCAAGQETSGGSSGQSWSAPPTDKEVLGYLLSNCDVPLTVHPSCEGVGTESGDATIGDYLSGFLARFAEARGRNWLRISAVPVGSVRDDPEAHWQMSVELLRADGEEEWAWGVTFAIRARDRTVIRESFQCIGAG